MKKTTGKISPWILFCLFCILIEMAVAGLYSYKPWGVLTSAIVFFLCVLGPGESLRRLLKLSSPIVEFRWALAFALGLVVLPLIYSLCTYWEQPWIAIAVLGLGSIPSILGWRRPRQKLAWGEMAWIVGVAAFLSLLVFVPSHRFAPSGAMTLPGPETFSFDLKYNALLINSVSNSFPPENPFVAGRPLNYHVGYPDLLALMGLLGGHNSLDTLLRFAPLWLWIFGLLGCFGACLGLGLTRPQARIATLLINLGGGLFALLVMLFTGFDQISVLFSLKLLTASNFLSNASLAATPIALVAMAAIGKHLSDQEGNWGIGALLLTTAVALYKSFFHPVLLAAWLLSLIVLRRRGIRSIFRYFLLSALLALPVWIWYALQNLSGAGLKLKLAVSFLEILGKIPFAWTQWLHEQFSLGGAIESTAVAIAGSVIFLIWIFGVGLLGLPSVWRHLIGRGRSSLTPAAWVVVIGTLVSWFLYDEPHVHVSSEWFIIYSQFALLLFAAPALARLFSKPLAGFVVAVVLFSGTFQSVGLLAAQRWDGRERLTAEQVRSSLELQEKTGGMCVAAISEKEDMAPVVLTGGVLYYHREFEEIATRYLSPQQAADRKENYFSLYNNGRIPDDIGGKRSFWAGFEEGPDPALFEQGLIVETVGGPEGRWLRLNGNRGEIPGD